jgi:2-dehydropantoate 2-reductase
MCRHTRSDNLQAYREHTIMEHSHPKITVIGAGAIGGVTAAFLSRAGWDVQIVCKRQEIAEQCSDPGLLITGLRGESLTPLHAVASVKELSGRLQVVLLATKATDCVSAAQELLPMLSDDGFVVSLQNGICEEALADVLGRERLIGCVVAWGATMLGPGRLEVTSPGEFVIGNLDGKVDPRLNLLKEALSGAAPTRISDNIMGELYSKLIVNSCINTLGALTGLTLGKLLASAQVRNIFLGLMTEAVAVANAMDIRIEPGGGGKLDYYTFLAGDGFWSRLRKHATVRVIGFKYRRIKSSSLQSLERGRPTEIDYLNGYICNKGRDFGVPTPLNDTVTGMVKEIESGQRKISPQNVTDPRLRL